jgi:hypothetical protein
MRLGRRAAAAVFGLLVLLLAPLSSAQAGGPFSNWSAVVVAGDFHAHSGGPTEAFDNARRDVSRTLVNLGFDKAAIQQFSVRPERYPADAPGQSDARTIYDALRIKAQTAKPAACSISAATAALTAPFWAKACCGRTCWPPFWTTPALTDPASW